jgi:hypothetical protein
MAAHIVAAHIVEAHITAAIKLTRIKNITIVIKNMMIEMAAAWEISAVYRLPPMIRFALRALKSI